MRSIEQRLAGARNQVRLLEIEQADQDGTMPGGDDAVCQQCKPFDCDDPDRHLGVPSKYTPLLNRGCRCGADFDGRDCMCFEGDY